MHDVRLKIAAVAELATVPSGRWGVGVSGGADSVALLRLLALRSDLTLHVIHLDHQTRGSESAADAAFVANLAASLRLNCSIARRDEVESRVPELSPNPSARYRAARLALFRREVAAHGLQGVILAHHADDQAETVLHRLIRGSGPAGLGGMSHVTDLSGLIVLRPLLEVRRHDLREWLTQIGQPWREDASNASDDYLRNRLRRWLARSPEFHDLLIHLAHICRRLNEWASSQAPRLAESFSAGQLSELPDYIAEAAARDWLIARGAPPGELSEAVLERLIDMARDAASAARVMFPGALIVRRRGGIISLHRS